VIKSDSLFLIENLENGENIMTAVKVLAVFCLGRLKCFSFPKMEFFKILTLSLELLEEDICQRLNLFY
jgi:hypothetical protein